MSNLASKNSAAVDHLLQSVADHYERLPRQLKSIANYIEHNSPTLVLDRVSDIAERCGVHPSAVVRFAQHFGFAGFGELQAVFRRAFRPEHPAPLSYKQRIRKLVRDQHAGRQEELAAATVAQNFIAGSRMGLDDLAAGFDEAAFEAAVDLLDGAGAIYVAGVRRSFPVASYTTYALQHTRKKVVQISGLGGMTRQQICSIGKGDVLFAITFAPYGRETQFCVKVARQQGAAVLLVTDSRLSALAKQAQVVLAVKESSVFAFRSLTNTMAICQAIFVALAYKMEIKIEETKEPREAYD